MMATTPMAVMFGQLDASKYRSLAPLLAWAGRKARINEDDSDCNGGGGGDNGKEEEEASGSAAAAATPPPPPPPPLSAADATDGAVTQTAPFSLNPARPRRAASVTKSTPLPPPSPTLAPPSPSARSSSPRSVSRSQYLPRRDMYHDVPPERRSRRRAKMKATGELVRVFYY